jgi:voltage-gated sodium channel
VADNTARKIIRAIVENKWFERLIVVVILLNTVVLGLATIEMLTSRFGRLLDAISSVCIGIFVIEAILEIFAWRKEYFKKAENTFDFILVVLSIIPAGSFLSGLRVIRVFRAFLALRVMSNSVHLRNITRSIVKSIPGIGWTVALMLVIYYIYAIIGIQLFRRDFPDIFTTLPKTFITLFSLTTLEGVAGHCIPCRRNIPVGMAIFLDFYDSCGVYTAKPDYRYCCG